MAYFTVTEFRDRFTDNDLDAYTDAQVNAVRETAEQSFEDACGVAFEPRTRTETLSGGGGTQLLARGPLITAVTAATVDGVTVDSATLKLSDAGVVYNANGWGRGFQNVTLTYTYGEATPPLRVKQAVMLLTRVWLVTGPVDERATQIPTETGGTINLATPGMFGATFGIPEVDATVEQYRRVAYIA